MIDRKLERQIEHSAALRVAAEMVADHAEQNLEQVGAPWMRRRGHSPIEVHKIPGGFRVVNTDFGAHLQEFGSANNPAHAPLRRAARSAGLHFKGLPK